MATYAVSGSASGIGASTRSKLESLGHTVIGIDLHDAEVTADLATASGRAAAVATTIKLCQGRLAGLLTAAGVGPPSPGPLVASVNYFGSHALLEGLRPALAASGQAQVVQIGSNSATVTPGLPDELIEAFISGDEDTARELVSEVEAPFGSILAYGGSKLAITRWCRRAAVGADWIGSGINLNVIAPGAVQTPLLEGGQNDDVLGPMMEALPIPTGSATSPDLIADWIIFMFSPAARFACGSVIYVDGGSDAVIRADAWPTGL